MSRIDCTRCEAAPCVCAERDHLAAASALLGPDELRVLVEVARRLELGRHAYGALAIDADPRDFAREAFEEAADLAVYSAVGLLKASAARRAALPTLSGEEGK